jgi:hypothetical protein
LMLVEDSVFSGYNKIESFDNPETSIQHRFVYCLKAILKLVTFVSFLGMSNSQYSIPLRAIAPL